jgi:trans-2,3-dihydro-3-hydroxyanthranilate isomerase
MTSHARRYVTADVFTHEMFGGNPLAVVLDAEGLSSAQMQGLASEFNYSETTFVLRAKAPGHTAQVRIFTPEREIPFAGHPNVGTAFVLARQLAEEGKNLPDRFVFEEKAGLVPVALLKNGATVMGAELTAPEALARHAKVEAYLAAACLSLAPEDVCVGRHQPQVLSVGLPFLVVELATRDALRRIKPDRVAYQNLLPLDGAQSIYAYTRDTGGRDDCDIEARMFTSRMTEDPATGSATAAAAGLLGLLRDVDDGEVRVCFRQGADMGRPSLLATRVVKQDCAAASIHVGGRCVPMMEGRFYLAGAA